jgi:Cu/Ag efflux protein CusF
MNISLFLNIFLKRLALFGSIALVPALCPVGFARGATPRLPAEAWAQAVNVRNAAKPSEPCCAITSIDAATGVVTAKAKSTGQSFQFKVADAALLSSLKTGQAVYANFKTQQVSVDGLEPCCQIVSTATGGVGAGTFEQNLGAAVNPGTPCCSITSINAATGVVTAKAKSTGQSLQFKVADAALLSSLKTGQAVYANFKTQQVSVDGGAPCCQIVSTATGGVGAGTFEQNLGAAVNPVEPCCAITSIDASGRVTAQDNTTGKTFQFQVKDSSLLNALHLGQSLSADFNSSLVTIYGAQPCCSITNSRVTSGAGTVPGSGSAPGAGPSGSSGATQTQEVEGTPGLAAELTEVTRSNDVLTIKMRFHNTSGKRVALDVTRSIHCDNYYVTAGQKRYAVLKDAQGVYQMPVQSYCRDTVVGIDPGQSWNWYGKFQAPPATVKKIDFFSPLMPPFYDVSITDK